MMTLQKISDRTDEAARLYDIFDGHEIAIHLVALPPSRLRFDHRRRDGVFMVCRFHQLGPEIRYLKIWRRPRTASLDRKSGGEVTG